MEPNKESPFINRFSWYQWSIVLLIPFIVIVMCALINENWINNFDQWIGNPVLSLRNPALTAFFVAITDFGDIYYIAVSILFTSTFLIWKFKDYQAALWLVIQSLVGSVLLNQGLKLIFHRSRPLVEHLVEQGGYSFPSGHSMGAMICYGAILFLLTKKINHKIYRNSLFFIGALLIFIVGLSRIYIGVHFSTDVIGGFSVGAAWLAFAIGMYPKWRNTFNKKTKL
ncbi:phosphatase PAP2 family protein [Desemzia sp. RIT804]|uniref:phosphatase PAP2 family protein n=1 Tax=Desemzia sp. RIT 804 TaxID=2810209 RepID=UPI00195275E1|nr:phosphatase PAP2 family protein [Desemzia sp. RIT 804]MBM6616055.1 phosphatase PAP2 family protein [Desemzia sp. RIT 804]